MTLKLTEGSLSANAVGQLLTSRGLTTPPQPQDSQPTLVGSPDNLDLHTADMLHIQACRWLEYIEGQVAVAESEALIARHEAKWELRRGQYRWGKNLEKWSEEDLDKLEKAELSQIKVEAAVVALKGVLSSLQKVKVAASRSITRQTKSDVSSDTGGRKWTNNY